MVLALTPGGSTTAGIAKRSYPLTVTIGGDGPWRCDLALAGPLATLVLRGSADALGAAVIGDPIELLHESACEVAAGARVTTTLGDELRVEARASEGGPATLRVVRARAYDLVSGAPLHETIDVTVAPRAAVARSPAPIAGGWVRGDRLGFALAHPALRARVSALSDATPLDFLTRDVRADALLQGGWVLPFLGLRPLWPYRVLVVDAAAGLALPLGQRVLAPRPVALAESEAHEVFGGEGLGAHAPRARARLAGLGAGAFALETFVAGGEVATFVLRPRAAGDAGAAVEPIVNCDVHARWREVAMEPLAVV